MPSPRVEANILYQERPILPPRDHNTVQVILSQLLALPPRIQNRVLDVRNLIGNLALMEINVIVNIYAWCATSRAIQGKIAVRDLGGVNKAHACRYIAVICSVNPAVVPFSVTSIVSCLLLPTPALQISVC